MTKNFTGILYKLLLFLCPLFILCGCGNTPEKPSAVSGSSLLFLQKILSAPAFAVSAQETFRNILSADLPVPEKASSGSYYSSMKDRPFIPPEISEQQFLCELSMFPGTLALRLLPTEDYPGYHMEVMRGEERLGSLSGYIPDEVSDKVFRGISDMGCYDVNYDNNTDIIFIEVWGDTSIAVVYLGDMSESFSFATFSHDIALSPGNGLPAEFEMTAANVYLFLTKGKDNGSFESYQEAYLALVNILRLYMPDSVTYDLIQLDDDGIPELVLVNGFNIYIYTYKDGTLYQAMDGWGYGAGGNPGIEYCPGKNGIRAYYSEQAGAIHGAVYYEMNRDHEVTQYGSIKVYAFIDTNHNDYPDEDEEFEGDGPMFANGREIFTEKELEQFEKGDYEYISGRLTYKELLAELGD